MNPPFKAGDVIFNSEFNAYALILCCGCGEWDCGTKWVECIIMKRDGRIMRYAFVANSSRWQVQ